MKRYLIVFFAALFCAVSAWAGSDPSPALAFSPGDLAWAAGVGLAFMGDTAGILDPKAIKAELDRISGEVKSYAEKALAEVKASGVVSAETKAAADKVLMEQGELRGRLSEVEQLIATVRSDIEGGGSRNRRPESLGRQFVNTEQFKLFASQARRKGRVDLEVNAAITSLSDGTDGAAGDLVQVNRLPGLQLLPQRRLTVRDLITPGRMDGNLLEYVQETGFTNNAGMVAETARKPESTMRFDIKQTGPRVIAHYVKASRQILDDASQLASYIDGRLRYGLALKEEDQLLNGDGVGQNLLGIIPQSTAYAEPLAPPAGTTWTIIDLVRLAMLQSELAEFPASGIVMNPIDWTSVELMKDDLGRYIIGNPQGTVQPTLWNRTVVATRAIAVDKFLTGGFQGGAQLFDRWLARVEVSTENEDDFVKNMVTILAEERLALAVYRPEAFIYGDFGRVA